MIAAVGIGTRIRSGGRTVKAMDRSRFRAASRHMFESDVGDGNVDATAATRRNSEAGLGHVR